jgi:hypothetical protein
MTKIERHVEARRIARELLNQSMEQTSCPKSNAVYTAKFTKTRDK